ncbi:hypothetical protein Dimus_005555 [Dionaea muscipula]
MPSAHQSSAQSSPSITPHRVHRVSVSLRPPVSRRLKTEWGFSPCFRCAPPSPRRSRAGRLPMVKDLDSNDEGDSSGVESDLEVEDGLRTEDSEDFDGVGGDRPREIGEPLTNRRCGSANDSVEVVRVCGGVSDFRPAASQVPISVHGTSEISSSTLVCSASVAGEGIRDVHAAAAGEAMGLLPTDGRQQLLRSSAVDLPRVGAQLLVGTGDSWLSAGWVDARRCCCCTGGVSGVGVCDVVASRGDAPFQQASSYDFGSCSGDLASARDQQKLSSEPVAAVVAQKTSGQPAYNTKLTSGMSASVTQIDRVGRDGMCGVRSYAHVVQVDQRADRA